MYESMPSKNWELTELGESASGMHLEHQVIRFQVVQNQRASGRRFHQVRWEGCSWLQIQVEQSHFYGVTFADCNFAEVDFQNCVFLDCVFEGAVLSQVRFGNCTFVDTRVSSGPVEGRVEVRHCLVLGRDPFAEMEKSWQSADKNWMALAPAGTSPGGTAASGPKAPAGFHGYQRPLPTGTATGARKELAAPKPAVLSSSAVEKAPSAEELNRILQRQREAEHALPLSPSPRFSELEKL